MTRIDAASDANRRQPSGPLLIWLAIQLLALGIGAARVKLWARAPLPGEQFSIDVMFVMQIVAASLLFPFVTRDLLTTITIASTSLPFIALAGLLSGTSSGRLMLAALYLILWLLGLAMLAQASMQPFARIASSCGLVLLSIGIPILVYLNREFSTSRSESWGTPLSPTLGVLAVLGKLSQSGWSWVSPIGAFSIGFVVKLARQRMRDSLSTSICPQPPTTCG